MTTRRELLIALGAGVLATPFCFAAQPQNKIWRVGFLSLRRPESLDTDIYGAFRQRMRELGYVEGKNVLIEWRFADGMPERYPGLAAEFARMKVDIIVTAGTAATGAAQKATNTIPIVIGNSADPVGSGLVKSLARPGGNITGLSNLNTDVSSKFLELLLSMESRLSRVAILMTPANSSHPAVFKNVQAAAQKTHVRILPMEARTPLEIDNAFSRMAKENAGAVIVAADPLFTQQRRQIAVLAAKYRLLSISTFRELAEAGLLISYGTNLSDIYRRAATYVDKIFKGAKPADLPVEQPTTFELVINGNTAKALGLTIPQSLLISATKVIE